MRGHDRALRVARTLADLDGRDTSRARSHRRGGRLPGAGMSACRRCLRRAAVLGAARAVDRACAERAPARARGPGHVERAADPRRVWRQAHVDRRVHRALRRPGRTALRIGRGPVDRLPARLRVSIGAAHRARRSRRPVSARRCRVARAAGVRARPSRSSVRGAHRDTERRWRTRSAATLAAAECPSSAAWRSASTRPRTRARSRPAARLLAVMPSGADYAYPRSHRAAAPPPCEQGLVLSELPPGFRPLTWCFPARNRIMAGLADMTIVVEGDLDVRVADHGAVRAGARAGRRRGSRPGDVCASRRARTRCWPTAPASCARQPTCSTLCTGRAPARSACRRARTARTAAGAPARRCRGGPGGRRDRSRGGAEMPATCSPA